MCLENTETFIRFLCFYIGRYTTILIIKNNKQTFSIKMKGCQNPKSMRTRLGG